MKIKSHALITLRTNLCEHFIQGSFLANDFMRDYLSLVRTATTWSELQGYVQVMRLNICNRITSKKCSDTWTLSYFSIKSFTRVNTIIGLHYWLLVQFLVTVVSRSVRSSCSISAIVLKQYSICMLCSALQWQCTFFVFTLWSCLPYNQGNLLISMLKYAVLAISYSNKILAFINQASYYMVRTVIFNSLWS